MKTSRNTPATIDAKKLVAKIMRTPLTLVYLDVNGKTGEAVARCSAHIHNVCNRIPPRNVVGIYRGDTSAFRIDQLIADLEATAAVAVAG